MDATVIKIYDNFQTMKRKIDSYSNRNYKILACIKFDTAYYLMFISLKNFLNHFYPKTVFPTIVLLNMICYTIH